MADWERSDSLSLSSPAFPPKHSLIQNSVCSPPSHPKPGPGTAHPLCCPQDPDRVGGRRGSHASPCPAVVLCSSITVFLFLPTPTVNTRMVDSAWGKNSDQILASPRHSCVTLRTMLTSLAQYVHLPDGHRPPQKTACMSAEYSRPRTHAAIQMVATAPLLLY